MYIVNNSNTVTSEINGIMNSNKFKQDHHFFVNTVEPCYKEGGYNKTVLNQGNFAGPSSLYFALPW